MNRGIARSIATVVFGLALAFAFSTGGLACAGKKCCPANTKQCQSACAKKSCAKTCAKAGTKQCPKAKAAAEEK
jgi:hypothetical protein